MEGGAGTQKEKEEEEAREGNREAERDEKREVLSAVVNQRKTNRLSKLRTLHCGQISSGGAVRF